MTSMAAATKSYFNPSSLTSIQNGHHHQKEKALLHQVSAMATGNRRTESVAFHHRLHRRLFYGTNHRRTLPRGKLLLGGHSLAWHLFHPTPWSRHISHLFDHSSDRCHQLENGERRRFIVIFLLFYDCYPNKFSPPNAT